MPRERRYPQPRALPRIALMLLLALFAAAAHPAQTAAAAAAPPPSPLAPAAPPERVDGLLRCSAERVLRPLSTSDVARMVSELYREALAAQPNKGTSAAASAAAAAASSPDPPPPPAVRVRATHSRFHTPTTLACPGDGQPRGAAGDAAAPSAAAKRRTPTALVAAASAEGPDARSAVGTAADPPADKQPPHPQRVALLTDGLDAVLEVQPAPLRRMRVQAGMTVGQLLAAASAVGMAVPVGALPAFSGLTLGGALATAAHGSGASTLADMVVEATWVDGTGRVHNSSLLGNGDGGGEGNSSSSGGGGRALVGGVGLTGVITELLLQLTPPTLTHALVAENVPDDDLHADLLDLLRSSEGRVTVAWRPDLRRYSAWALYPETERQAERRRRRRQGQGRPGGGGGGGGGDEALADEEEEDDARATATPFLEAALAPAAAAPLLLAWQRDVDLQGGPREEAAACALAAGEGGAPFAYPPAAGPGWGRRRRRSSAGAGGARTRKAAALGGGRGGDDQQQQQQRRRWWGLRSVGRASSSSSSSPRPLGARVPATDRFTAAFIGPTNAMAAAGCAPSAAAAAKNKDGPPLCAWAPPGGGGGAPGTAAAATAVRASRGGSGFHLALDLSQLATWIDDARWALEADLQDDAAIPFGKGRCLPPGSGIVFRFGGGLAGGDVDVEAAAAGEDAGGNDDRDVRMDLAAPPDPAQLDDDARQEAADDDDEAAASGGLLPLPPVLAASSSNSSNGTAAAPAALLEVDEVSAAGFLSPVAGLKQPVYIQFLAATYEEEGEEEEGGGTGGGSGSGDGSAAPAAARKTPPTTKYGWFIDALERFTYCAYNTSAPHWGDSSERALLLAAGGDDGGCVAGGGGGAGAGRIPGFAQQLEAQRRYDPLGLFEPELFARIRRAAAAAEARRRRRVEQEEEEGGWVAEEEDATAEAAGGGGGGNEDEDGCAADGRCWCTEDRHCAPRFGCVESNAYSGVMVCKPWAVIAAAETGPADEGEAAGDEPAVAAENVML